MCCGANPDCYGANTACYGAKPVKCYGANPVFCGANPFKCYGANPEWYGANPVFYPACRYLHPRSRNYRQDVHTQGKGTPLDGFISVSLCL